MNDYEVSFSKRLVVEDRFEQQGIAAGLFVKSAGAVNGMDVHGEAKPTRLVCDLAKKEVLECLVVSSRGLAAVDITRIDAPSGNNVSFLKVELA